MALGVGQADSASSVASVRAACAAGRTGRREPFEPLLVVGAESTRAGGGVIEIRKPERVAVAALSADVGVSGTISGLQL